jgi:uncharacterized protein YggU (UPF0235/DUF167 family)
LCRAAAKLLFAACSTNQSLIEFLAKRLGVKKNAVSIISGQTGPVKHVQVQGVSRETLLEKLNLNKQGSD